MWKQAFIFLAIFPAWPMTGQAAPLGGRVDQLDIRFNAEARILGIDVRMSLMECEPRPVRRMCTYRILPELLVVAMTTRKENNNILNEMMLLGGTAHSAEYIFATHVFMGALAPAVSPKERGLALVSLLSDLPKAKNVILDGVMFSISAPEDLGIWLRVSRDGGVGPPTTPFPPTQIP